MRDKFAENHNLRAIDAGFDSVIASINGSRIDSWALIRGIADYQHGQSRASRMWQVGDLVYKFLLFCEKEWLGEKVIFFRINIYLATYPIYIHSNLSKLLPYPRNILQYSSSTLERPIE